jgi:hypothetical protein
MSQGIARSVDFPSVVSRRRFKSPRTALHHGLVTCPKTFRIKAISMVRSMAGLALWNFRLKLSSGYDSVCGPAHRISLTCVDSC